MLMTKMRIIEMIMVMVTAMVIVMQMLMMMVNPDMMTVMMLAFTMVNFLVDNSTRLMRAISTSVPQISRLENIE